MTRPKFKLLKHAYAIIDGIPDERFNLGTIAENEDGEPANNPHSCGTIACAAGWLGMHPDFIKRGLRTLSVGGLATTPDWSWWDDIIQEVFELESDEVAIDLFGSRGDSRYDLYTPRITDKQLFQHRVRCFLKEHNQL